MLIAEGAAGSGATPGSPNGSASGPAPFTALVDSTGVVSVPPSPTARPLRMLSDVRALLQSGKMQEVKQLLRANAWPANHPIRKLVVTPTRPILVCSLEVLFQGAMAVAMHATWQSWRGVGRRVLLGHGRAGVRIGGASRTTCRVAALCRTIALPRLPFDKVGASVRRSCHQRVGLRVSGYRLQSRHLPDMCATAPLCNR